MKVSIYQINYQRLSNAPIWKDKGGVKPATNAVLYDEVFRGEGTWEDIHEVVSQFEGEAHPLFRGRQIQPTDVFVTDQGTFFKGWDGMVEVDFDQTQAQKQENLLRVVYVEPNRPAYETEIGADLHSQQKAVGGLIELVNMGNRCFLVCNDEGKLMGMEGNRRLGNGSVIAGPFFIVGDSGEDFCSLTDAQVNHYLQQFSQPEQISQREVQADMGFTFYSF